jgi:DNA (cytosine-5)-methyltransferase 1
MIGIDLFSGAGGMSLGAKLAGVDVQLAVENDPHAAKTYKHNHPTTKIYRGDVRRLSKRYLKPWLKKHNDLVVFGGPPCQGFSWSNARTRNTGNNANWLFREFVRVV